MNWIIWTIGWFLVIESSSYLSKKEGHSIEVRGISALIKIIIWIIGMVKFW